MRAVGDSTESPDCAEPQNHADVYPEMTDEVKTGKIRQMQLEEDFQNPNQLRLFQAEENESQVIYA